MPIPAPEPGLVISYAYLWHREREAARVEGRKDRPSVIVLAASVTRRSEAISQDFLQARISLRSCGLLASNANATPGFDLPFVVQGPWDDPLIFPDPESLIRRSPASAPLLDAVKDRKTRDAVRSVLERFTGGGQKAPEAPMPIPPAAADAKPN